MVIPQIAYGCSLWYTPQGGKGYTDKMRTTLSRIQSEAARTIAGAYRATSAAALDVELFILPINHQLEKRAHETAIKIWTRPVDPSSGTSFVHTTPVTAPTMRGLSQHHIIQVSPLKRLINLLERKLGTETLNNLEVWEAFVVEPWWTPTPNHYSRKP